MINALIISATLLTVTTQEAPAPITAINEPTESAKAVYLTDAAAEKRGHRSELAVLGTAHLRGLPGGFDLKRFRPLLNRLEAWAPDRIAIESVSGAQCDHLRDYAFAYDDPSCPDPVPARTAFGVTGPEAAAKIKSMLATPAPDRPAAERRRLAGLFLAAGDPSSALVQWLRLVPTKRTAVDGLTDGLVEYLDARSKRKNENIIIAVSLAVRLGHERVYRVDDHTGNRALGPIDKEVYVREIMEIWDNDWNKVRSTINKDWDKRLVADTPVSVLDWYRMYLNSPELAKRAVASDFSAAAGADSSNNTGRKYLAYWETRNMRMAANIREVIGEGGRVLAIVGASHKPYYERYLGVTSDLEIVNMQKLLD